MKKQHRSRKYYRKKNNHQVTAIQLKLVTNGLRYEKWGASQTAKADDWLVENNGECYTVAADVFARTYQQVSAGRFVKVTVLQAYQASESGVLKTLEGSTRYQPGDYIVSNDPDNPADIYAVEKHRFEELYAMQDQHNP